MRRLVAETAMKRVTRDVSSFTVVVENLSPGSGGPEVGEPHYAPEKQNENEYRAGSD